MNLVHRHLLIYGILSDTPKDTSLVESWLRDLIALVGMKILVEPKCVYCETEGNEGMTGIACLETSHCSIHVWDADKTFKMDLYSCQDFRVKTVLDHLRVLGMVKYKCILVDRDTNEILLRIE